MIIPRRVFNRLIKDILIDITSKSFRIQLFILSVFQKAIKIKIIIKLNNIIISYLLKIANINK